MGFNLNSMIMKKILLVLFVVSFAFISCTDNTEEHEELVNAIHATEKGDAEAPGTGGGEDDNSED